MGFLLASAYSIIEIFTDYSQNIPPFNLESYKKYFENVSVLFKTPLLNRFTTFGTKGFGQIQKAEVI